MTPIILLYKNIVKGMNFIKHPFYIRVQVCKFQQFYAVFEVSCNRGFSLLCSLARAQQCGVHLSSCKGLAFSGLAAVFLLFSICVKVIYTLFWLQLEEKNEIIGAESNRCSWRGQSVASQIQENVTENYYNQKYI